MISRDANSLLNVRLKAYSITLSLVMNLLFHLVGITKELASPFYKKQDRVIFFFTMQSIASCLTLLRQFMTCYQKTGQKFSQNLRFTQAAILALIMLPSKWRKEDSHKVSKKTCCSSMTFTTKIFLLWLSKETTLRSLWES